MTFTGSGLEQNDPKKTGGGGLLVGRTWQSVSNKNRDSMVGRGLELLETQA